MENHKVNYVEFMVTDLSQTKQFFQTTFGWQFKEWGPDYMDSTDGGITTGFIRSDATPDNSAQKTIIGFYSQDLESRLLAIEKAGGKIVKPIFAFPGGRRFQFTEPSGNEFIIWSDR